MAMSGPRSSATMRNASGYLTRKVIRPMGPYVAAARKHNTMNTWLMFSGLYPMPTLSFSSPDWLNVQNWIHGSPLARDSAEFVYPAGYQFHLNFRGTSFSKRRK